MINNIKNRKKNRAESWNYSFDGFYFITICTKNKENYFGSIVDGKMALNSLGRVVEKCFIDILQHYKNIEIDKFIIMPNHLHGIIIINSAGNRLDEAVVGNRHACSLRGIDVGVKTAGNRHACSLRGMRRQNQILPSVVGSFKAAVTKEINKMNNDFVFVWQKSFYDHIIRSEEELIRIREYIINNPLRWDTDRNNDENLFM